MRDDAAIVVFKSDNDLPGLHQSHSCPYVVFGYPTEMCTGHPGVFLILLRFYFFGNNLSIVVMWWVFHD